MFRKSIQTVASSRSLRSNRVSFWRMAGNSALPKPAIDLPDTLTKLPEEPAKESTNFAGGKKVTEEEIQAAIELLNQQEELKKNFSVY